MTGDQEKKTVQVKLENGETLDLNYNDQTSSASGYFPQVGDKVSITYLKEGMLLQSIQLVERPAPAADTAADTAQQ